MEHILSLSYGKDSLACLEACKLLGYPIDRVIHAEVWVFTDTKMCVSCWKLNWKERLSALFFGTIWLGILSGATQPPVWLDCTRTVFVEGDKKE